MTDVAIEMPSVDDVASYLLARTLDSNGNRAGTFNTDTHPTALQATALITQAAQPVEAAVGTTIPENSVPIVKSVVALGTALLVELTYFPEAIKGPKSSYPELKAMYDDRFKLMRTAVSEMQDGGDPGDELDPEYYFPDTANPSWDDRAW